MAINLMAYNVRGVVINIHGNKCIGFHSKMTEITQWWNTLLIRMSFSVSVKYGCHLTVLLCVWIDFIPLYHLCIAVSKPQVQNHLRVSSILLLSGCLQNIVCRTNFIMFRH